MNVGDSVRLAIDAWQAGEFEAAMLHACNAIDGTAKKAYPNETGSNARFTRLLRENYSILGPMGAPGINLESTRFPVRVERPKAAGGHPDLADVLYGVHRCSHGHGEALPDGFELHPDAAGGPGRTRMSLTRGTVQLSDRVIFGLLAVAVLAPVNADQRVPAGYVFFYSTTAVLPIDEWWGRAHEFPDIVATDPPPGPVTLDFREWGTPAQTEACVGVPTPLRPSSRGHSRTLAQVSVIAQAPRRPASGDSLTRKIGL